MFWWIFDCRLLFFFFLLCRNNFHERNTGCSQRGGGGGTIALKETHKEALSAPFHLGRSFARHLSVSNVLITAV